MFAGTRKLPADAILLHRFDGRIGHHVARRPTGHENGNFQVERQQLLGQQHGPPRSRLVRTPPRRLGRIGHGPDAAPVVAASRRLEHDRPTGRLPKCLDSSTRVNVGEPGTGNPALPSSGPLPPLVLRQRHVLDDGHTVCPSRFQVGQCLGVDQLMVERDHVAPVPRARATPPDRPASRRSHRARPGPRHRPQMPPAARSGCRAEWRPGPSSGPVGPPRRCRPSVPYMR